MASRRGAPAQPPRTSRSHDHLPAARPGDLRVAGGQRIAPAAHSVTLLSLAPASLLPQIRPLHFARCTSDFPPRDMFPGSSTVEHSAVNRRVASSNLARGANSSRNLQMEIKRSGSQPSTKGPAEYFTGTVRVDPLHQAPNPARVVSAAVTFEPGAR